MSMISAPVTTIDHIQPHTNADKLELAQVMGWQLVVPKGQYAPGDRVVYFCPDTVMPIELSDKIGVTQYLHRGRVSCTRLRGEPSFGIAITPDDPSWEVGRDVADYYGVSKYVPPVRPTRLRAHNDGQPGRDLYANELPFNPLFPKYTKIENMRNFPTVFEEGEEVYVTEKIHGTNSRLGMVDGVWMAGSHNVQRKPFLGVEGATPEECAREENSLTKLYWYPYSLQPVRDLVTALATCARQVVVYGEIYGASIQSFHYGFQQESLGYRVFDILMDGKFAEWGWVVARCTEYGVEYVPELDQIAFTLAKVKTLSEGPTTLLRPGSQAIHMREGVVVRPLQERHDSKIGRVILKYVSDSYLLDKRKTDWSDDI